MEISIRSNIKDIQKSLSQLAMKQLPFATASALTGLAKLVKAGETKNIKDTFKNPSPFTLNSVRIQAARKANPVATVFMMDTAAEYLEPYEVGGAHKLASKALLNPKDISLNQYGQLSKNTIAKLKARPDIFIGPVKTAKGIVNGVWQRVTDVKKVTLLNAKGKRLRGLNKKTDTSTLKLLVRFGDALQVKQRLNYRERAQAIINANFNTEFKKAMDAALDSAK